jgi:hypothetical protein
LLRRIPKLGPGSEGSENRPQFAGPPPIFRGHPRRSARYSRTGRRHSDDPTGEPAGKLVEIARLTLAGAPAGWREVEHALREGDDRAVDEGDELLSRSADTYESLTMPERMSTGP